jgi:hypothetical protein
MPDSTLRKRITTGKHEAIITSIATDGRLLGHVPGHFISTWWHPDGRHNLYRNFDLRTDPLADFDHATAQAEGWVLSDAGISPEGVHCMQIRRLENPRIGQTRFADDHDAWAHVVARARKGSLPHRDALTRIDHIERNIIEIAHGSW